ncbi:MAG: hypothetical protein SPG81_04100 [Candidatus Egerieousia sp.]|nr:hypothetical protein [Candidatus Egerieousia sp.]
MPASSRCSQLLPDAHSCFPMRTAASQCAQLLPNAHSCFPMRVRTSALV